MWGDIAIAFLLAFITAFVLTPYTMRLAKKVGAIDVPDDRRVNKTAMPRLGGLAVICGFLVSTIYLLIVMSIENSINLFGEEQYAVKMLGFLAGIIILGITCFIDDSKGVPSWVKLIAQIASASIVVACGIKIENINLPFIDNKIWFYDWVSYILTIGWIVGITNAINLIDGLDGLSSGITLISCISLIMIFTLNKSPLIAVLLITALGGSIVGFLPFNFSPAKTFIGDVGSNFLGFCLAVISILRSSQNLYSISFNCTNYSIGLPNF